ncbi:hypothetical protein T265_00353 [Opisthorchis viverrini]|uniref:Uncharacterized protein n=1 Tax=Opisthorchis viverrini TaxID=6198 RepID=A0A075A6D0_OPIVI|nr:hypothetical protein T265_00353 [Opisthorchis viverrini]KER33917.1 hypothetical protein T265_00353 [Opisthorchis viverrini]
MLMEGTIEKFRVGTRLRLLSRSDHLTKMVCLTRCDFVVSSLHRSDDERCGSLISAHIETYLPGTIPLLLRLQRGQLCLGQLPGQLLHTQPASCSRAPATGHQAPAAHLRRTDPTANGGATLRPTPTKRVPSTAASRGRTWSGQTSGPIPAVLNPLIASWRSAGLEPSLFSYDCNVASCASGSYRASSSTLNRPVARAHPQLGTKRRLHTFDELIRQQMVARHSVQPQQSAFHQLLQAGEEHGRVRPQAPSRPS